jgi:[ribosomal protein S5]-alanine N-acetyltransferase
LGQRWPSDRARLARAGWPEPHPDSIARDGAYVALMKKLRLAGRATTSCAHLGRQGPNVRLGSAPIRPSTCRSSHGTVDRCRSYAAGELAEVAAGLRRILHAIARGELSAEPGEINRLEGAVASPSLRARRASLAASAYPVGPDGRHRDPRQPCLQGRRIRVASRLVGCDDDTVDAVFRPGFIPEPGELHVAGVVIRRWEYGDLSCIREASVDPVIPTGTTVPTPFSDFEGRAYIQRQWGRHTSGEGLSLAMADRSTDVAVGQINLLHRQQPGIAGIGYWVVASRRGEGFASNAVRALSRWALNLSTLVRLEALVEPENMISCHVLERSSFRREGLLRQYLDLGDRRADALLFSLLPGDVGLGDDVQDLAMR